MNTAIIAGAQGLCFAIAIDTVQQVALELLRHGRVRRASLGVAAHTVPLSQRVRRHFDLVARAVVRVSDVEAGGPAAQAAMQTGDLIVRFAGEPVSGIDDLHRLLIEQRIGARVATEVLRGSRRMTLEVVPRELNPG